MREWYKKCEDDIMNVKMVQEMKKKFSYLGQISCTLLTVFVHPLNF